MNIFPVLVHSRLSDRSAETPNKPLSLIVLQKTRSLAPLLPLQPMPCVAPEVENANLIGMPAQEDANEDANEVRPRRFQKSADRIEGPR
jgi:hypothetical protein